MGNYNFRKDLQIALEKEKEVALFLESEGATEVEFNSDNRWDLRIRNKNGQYRTVEIKEDKLFSETGNVAIELESRGKESGINTSWADVWIYILGNNYYSSTLSNLQSEIRRGNFRVVKGGDGKTSKLVLIPLEKFYKIFKKVR